MLASEPVRPTGPTNDLGGAWDYIVIGGGSAGCVVASRLSEDADVRVLLLEAGGSDRSPVILAPAATDVYGLGRPAWDWCYTAEADPSREGRTEFWPRGKVLGGSSSINGTIYIRGHPLDYDHWAELGADGWAYDDVLPYFRRAENNDSGESEYRGTGGPLSVQRLRYIHPLTRRFVAAAVERGLPFNPDLNGASQDGVGYNQATQRRGWRHSTARAYLGPARRRRNLKIVTRAHATRILFAGDRACGVEYRWRGGMHRAEATREIVLSAGAIESPHLLMLSGIGPADTLAQNGIDVVADSPEVGENLQEHPGAWLTFQMRERTLNNETGLVRQAIHGLNWLAFGRGPATTAGAQAVAFCRTDASEKQPDIQFHFTPVGYKFLPTHLVLYKEPTVSVLVNVCRPLSRGRLVLQSADPTQPLRIDMPLLGNSEDVKVLTAGCRVARDIMNSPAIADVVVAERDPGTSVQSDAEWEAYLRRSAVACYHPVGTCRMGRDDGVVDPELRVRGVSGLRVVDASVMPTVPSGNTNAVAIMIGEKAADLIRGQYA